jgi:hypothetical protein
LGLKDGKAYLVYSKAQKDCAIPTVPVTTLTPSTSVLTSKSTHTDTHLTHSLTSPDPTLIPPGHEEETGGGVNIGLIVGCAVGGLVGAVLFTVGGYYLYHHYLHHHHYSEVPTNDDEGL